MGIEPETFLSPKVLVPAYLCKFRKTLTPDEMKQDIIFSPAPDNTRCVEHIVKW